MAIEITEFTNVSIAVSPVGVQGGNFGILGFLTKSSDNAINAIAPAERGRAYKSLAGVGGDWGANSEVYKAASAFFGQTPTPTDFVVLMNFDTAQAAQLVGGTHDTLEELKSITSGEFDITVDGTVESVTGLDLSGAADLDAVAALIGAELTSATCTYGGFGFLVTSNTTGSSSTITPATDTDAAISLGLIAALAKYGDGVKVETPVESLTACVSKGIEFVGLDMHRDWRDTIILDVNAPTGETAEDVAQWANANKKIFMNTANSLSVLNSSLRTDVIATMMDRVSSGFVLSIFSKNPAQYPGSSVFGRAASVNFNGINSTITLNLKQMPGIAVEDLSPTELATLRDKRGSAVVRIGKTAQGFTEGRMSNGSWLDTTHGLLWLENRCETDMFNLLYQTNTKIPFTQAGINSTAARLDQSLRAAVNNGLAGPGYLPDGTYLPEGYRIFAAPLGSVPSGDKGNRVYHGLSFEMVGAGALQEVSVAGSFSE